MSASKHLLKVNEIFYSIQGEGPNTGRPAVFLRLAGCNLRCKWCDTKYSWNETNNQSMTNKKIIQQIKKYPCKNLVITGGEPLLQQTKLEMLLKSFKGCSVELETNGSLPLKINKYFEQINCSPKLRSSGNIPCPLRILPANRKVIYKFVISNKSDVDEIKKYCATYKIPNKRVWLMPEGVSRNKILVRSQWLIEICKKEGYNFSPRLHIMLWGNRRAV